MRLNEMAFADRMPVDGYGPGFFRIGGARRDGPHALLPDAVLPWGGLADFAPFLDRAAAIDVLLVGMGGEIAALDPQRRAALEGAGIGVETMATPAACRSYNVLLSEGRRVAAALLPV
ncbi:MAG: Mth938-like domain-containing protein [Pseudomonadota bacterium]